MGILLSGLATNDPVISADSARLLGDLALIEAVDPLLDYVEQSPYYSKTAGFHALMQIGQQKACCRIVPLIDNPHVYDDWFWCCARAVRFSAALALLVIDPAQESGFIDEVCENGKSMDYLYPLFSPVIVEMDETHEKIVRLKKRTLEFICAKKYFKPDIMALVSPALGLVGDAASVEQLKWIAKAPSRFARGEAIFHLLASGNGSQHVDLGAELCETDPALYVRIKAAAGLLLLGQEECINLIENAIDGEKDSFLRATAVEMAGKVKCAKAIPSLIRRLNDTDSYVRQCAVEALEFNKDPVMVQKIEAAMEDCHPRVRMQAAKFLMAFHGGNE